MMCMPILSVDPFSLEVTNLLDFQSGLLSSFRNNRLAFYLLPCNTSNTSIIYVICTPDIR